MEREENQEANPGGPPATAESDRAAPPAEHHNGDSGEVIGSAAIRPVFLGNLVTNYSAGMVQDLFEKPIPPPNTAEGTYTPVAVDRVDLKRGYCFVFLKDATCQADKDNAERFVSAIHGMEVPNVSVSLRAEFARGDGRIKRKEDDRRRNIHPSETLFVVNFHEETTKREDLQMLFEPFGELVRIDMKRNYAFVQFRTIEEATRAKDVTNGGKLDQSVLTVEFVARQRGDQNDGRRRRRDDRDRRGGGDRRIGGGDRFRGPPQDRFDRRGGYDRDRNDDFRGGGGAGRDDFRGRGRDRSPGGYRGASPGGYRGASPGAYRGGSPRGAGGGAGGGGGGYQRRSRSRSRSPPRGAPYRSRSPPRRGGYDDRDRGGRYEPPPDRRFSPDNYRGGPGGARSPERDVYRGGRDDRGYRP